MIKVVLFDADGVLINGVQFSSQLARDYGISKEQTKEFFTHVLPQTTIGQADLKEILTPYLEEWGWKKSIDDFLEYWFTSEHHIDEALVNYIQSLRQRGIICCLATNQEKYRIDYMLTKMDFADMFDMVYVSCHLGVQKPDLSYFQKILDDLDAIKKDEVLFWDDSPSHIQGAKDFGIHAELYTSFADFQQKMASYL